LKSAYDISSGGNDDRVLDPPTGEMGSGARLIARRGGCASRAARSATEALAK